MSFTKAYGKKKKTKTQNYAEFGQTYNEKAQSVQDSFISYNPSKWQDFSVWCEPNSEIKSAENWFRKVATARKQWQVLGNSVLYRSFTE